MDDSAAVRGAIRQFVEAATRLCVCGEADNGLEAVQKAKDSCCELVLLDIGMPHLNGIGTVEAPRLALPNVKLVGFSMEASQHREELLAAKTFDAVLSKFGGLTKLVETLKYLVPVLPLVKME